MDPQTRGSLSSTLLYSQKRFVLPKNLHIIGTMNTTEVVDPAVYKNLRHFEFISTEPNSNLVADFGCNFSKKFELMNKKLDVILVKHYRIGHCYFLKSSFGDADVNDLRKIWVNNIIPLLSVYFKADWEKIQLLFGKAKAEGSFVRKIDDSFMTPNDLANVNSLYEYANLLDENCHFEEMLNYAFSEVAMPMLQGA